jgi:hypothetical protein
MPLPKGLVLTTIRWYILCSCRNSITNEHHAYLILDTGSIHASTVLYKSELQVYTSHFLYDDCCAVGLLETVLFANIRFHDTVSRGRLLNRFGKDFEGRSSSIMQVTHILLRARYR